MEKIQKKYAEHIVKFSLPSYCEIDSDFEIFDIDDEKYMLREIRKRIHEKIEDYVKIIEPFLQPEAFIKDMHECKILNDEEKKKIYALYKRLMFFGRYSIEISINENDEKSALFINEVFKEWDNIKKKILFLVVKMKESWLNETDDEEKVGYMG
jgi:hypothetical protein